MRCKMKEKARRTTMKEKARRTTAISLWRWLAHSPSVLVLFCMCLLFHFGSLAGNVCIFHAWITLWSEKENKGFKTKFTFFLVYSKVVLDIILISMYPHGQVWQSSYSCSLIKFQKWNLVYTVILLDTFQQKHAHLGMNLVTPENFTLFWFSSVP